MADLNVVNFFRLAKSNPDFIPGLKEFLTFAGSDADALPIIQPCPSLKDLDAAAILRLEQCVNFTSRMPPALVPNVSKYLQALGVIFNPETLGGNDGQADSDVLKGFNPLDLEALKKGYV